MNRLRDVRKSRNITLRKMSTEIEIPYSTLSNYENENREPNLATWIILADYFGVDVPYIQGVGSKPFANEYDFLSKLSSVVHTSDAAVLAFYRWLEKLRTAVGKQSIFRKFASQWDADGMGSSLDMPQLSSFWFEYVFIKEQSQSAISEVWYENLYDSLVNKHPTTKWAPIFQNQVETRFTDDLTEFVANSESELARLVATLQLDLNNLLKEENNLTQPDMEIITRLYQAVHDIKTLASEK